MSDEELVGLVTTMVDSFVQSGKVKPVLPKGCDRKGFVSCLRTLLADVDALDRYLDKLRAQQWEEGIYFRQFAQFGVMERILTQSVAGGFDSLSDDDLAYLLFSPPTLSATQEAWAQALHWVG